MPYKNFTTYEEQIDLLISRGINITSDNDKTFAKEVLKKVGYYGLINGYKEPFIDRDNKNFGEQYKAGTTLQEIYALYEFDRVLRETFMSFILKFETRIKALFLIIFQKHTVSTIICYIKTLIQLLEMPMFIYPS